MSNPVFDTIQTVLAIRQYQDRPVAPDVVERIVEAARLTASGMNRQPWHFVVVREREGLADLGRMVTTGPYIAGAAGAIVVAVERGNQMAVADASRAIQSMVLAAWAEGVGTNWAGWGPDPARHDDVRRALGLPESLQVLGVVPYGYPAQPAGRGKKNRRPRAEVVSEGRYGVAFP